MVNVTSFVRHAPLIVGRNAASNCRMGSLSGASRAWTHILLVGAACLVAGCTTAADPQVPGMAFAGDATAAQEASGDADPAVAYDDNVAYPGRAVYSCDDGEKLTVDNAVTNVHIALADGSALDMPASPPDSRNRYVNGQHALVLDGEEALYMRPKTTPVSCRRGTAQASID